MSTQSTVEQIEQKISAARERLRTLDCEAKELSLPAVSGDGEAVAAVARVNASIRQVTADLALLNNAYLFAAREEAEARAEVEAVRRRDQMAIAKRLAVDIVGLGTQADEYFSLIKALLSDLADAERKIGDALRAAGEPPNAAIIGRRGLGGFLIERLVTMQNGRDLFLSEQRPIAVIAAAAWDGLLDSDTKAECRDGARR